MYGHLARDPALRRVQQLVMKLPWPHAFMVVELVGKAWSFVPLHPYVAEKSGGTFLQSSKTSLESTPSTELSTPRRSPLSGDELISLGLDEMAEVLGGTGRAKMVWAALAEGVDPFSSQTASDYLTPKTAQQLNEAFKCRRLPWQVGSLISLN